MLASRMRFFRSCVLICCLGLCSCSSSNVGPSSSIGSDAGSAAGARSASFIAGEAENHKERVAQQEEILRRQKLEMERQKREMQDLRRQEYYNNRFRQHQ